MFAVALRLCARCGRTGTARRAAAAVRGQSGNREPCCSTTAVTSTTATSPATRRSSPRTASGSAASARSPAADIKAFMEKAMGTQNTAKNYHLLSNFVITVNGDTATAWSRWAFVVPGQQGAAICTGRPLRRRTGERERTLEVQEARRVERHARTAPAASEIRSHEARRSRKVLSHAEETHVSHLRVLRALRELRGRDRAPASMMPRSGAPARPATTGSPTGSINPKRASARSRTSTPPTCAPRPRLVLRSEVGRRRTGSHAARRQRRHLRHHQLERRHCRRRAHRQEKWRWDPWVNQTQVRPEICCGVVNRGLAIYQGTGLRAGDRRPAAGARRGHRQGGLGIARGVPAGSLHADDGAADRQGQGDHRRERRRSSDARILRRLRRDDRPARVALLYRARRSVEAVRERRDEEGGRDVGQGVVEERRRRRGVGRLCLRRRRGTRLRRHRQRRSRGRSSIARRARRTTCTPPRSSPSTSTPAS